MRVFLDVCSTLLCGIQSLVTLGELLSQSSQRTNLCKSCTLSLYTSQYQCPPSPSPQGGGVWPRLLLALPPGLLHSALASVGPPLVLTLATPLSPGACLDVCVCVCVCVCAVLWCVKTSVDLLISDPFSSLAATFVPSLSGETHCKA